MQFSILREEQYKELEKLNFFGSVLDIGGSKLSGYHDLLKGKTKVVTCNIDKDYGCDLIFDVQNKFPIETSTFDTVIALNLIEHVLNYENVFLESHRVLKSGGRLIVAVPFLFHIHASPNDYFRYTSTTLNSLGEKYGFSKIDIKLLGYGLFSLNYQIISGAIPNKYLRLIFKKIAIFFDKLLLNFKSYKRLSEKIPLGYFVVYTK